MTEIETVKLKRNDLPGGCLIINRDDLKPDDVLFEDDSEPRKKKSKKS